jgi:cytochrome P450 family 6
VAQAFSFLAAGFETSGTTLSYALYELALHPDIQSRLREEIKQVLDKHQGQLTYKGMNELSYLDMVIKGMLTEAGYIVWIVIFCIVSLPYGQREREMFLQTLVNAKFHVTIQETTSL